MGTVSNFFHKINWAPSPNNRPRMITQDDPMAVALVKGETML